MAKKLALYFIPLILFLGSLNFNLNEETIPGTLVLVYRGILVVLKLGVIALLGHTFRFPKNSYSILFVVWLVHRFISLDFELKPILLFVEYIATVLVILLYVSSRSFHVKYLIKLLRLFVIYICVIALFLPNRSFTDAGGVLPMLQLSAPRLNANAVGQLAVLVLIGTSSTRLKVPAILILLLSQSRASIAFAFFLVLKNSSRIFKVIIIFFTMFLSTYLATYLLRGQEIGGLLTLSNRTIIWMGLFNIILQPSFLFFGKGPFTAIDSVTDSLGRYNDFITITIDNSFLELWLESGFLSLLLLSVLIIKALNYYKSKTMLQTLFIFLIFRGLFTSSLLLYSNFLFLVLLCLPIYETKAQNN